MEKEIKVTSLTHEELVNLFSTALYGDNTFCIDVPSRFEDLWVGECFEDKIANVLLHGGRIKLRDNYSANADDDVEVYGNGTDIIVETKSEELLDNLCYYAYYSISLDSILAACSTSEGYRLASELFIDEDGDFYTAYNLLQLIVFGEVVYG